MGVCNASFYRKISLDLVISDAVPYVEQQDYLEHICNPILLSIVLGYAPYQENAAFNAAKKLPSEEDRLAITELFNKKQGLMVELQHYEANAVTNQSGRDSSLDSIRPVTAMPTNTRLQVAVTPAANEVNL